MKFGTMHLQFSKSLFSGVVKQKSSSCGKNPWVQVEEKMKKSRTKPIHRMTDDGCGVSLKSLLWSDPPIPIRPDDGWGVRATYTHPSGGSGFVYYESIKWEVKVWLTQLITDSTFLYKLREWESHTGRIFGCVLEKIVSDSLPTSLGVKTSDTSTVKTPWAFPSRPGWCQKTFWPSEW